MTKIPLRSYTREIESLIERGMNEEALGHCRFILKHYPKYIEAYRLLGKAFLESQRYSEAADILQRILSVFPDDFFAQIGMSIIREDEGNLDAAIFHMERAYETQPANIAIQDELRRLYGRRDGVEPPKLRLSRGALVRMYVRGGLNRQAVAEIHAALQEDPQRIDLEVILAKIHHSLGEKAEAAEIASRLVAKLPFCYEANQILADILPSTAHAQDAQIYIDRLLALDPYLAYLTASAPSSQQVPDNAIMIDRLEWQSVESTPQQPAWAQLVGVNIETETPPEPADWLSGMQTEEETPPKSSQFTQAETVDAQEVSPALELTSEETPPDSTDLPDWLRDAGWTPSSQPESEPAQPVFAEEDESLLEEEPARAELPDWLKSLEPAELKAEEPDEAEQERLDLLEQILPPMLEETPEATPEEVSELISAEIPSEPLPAPDMEPLTEIVDQAIPPEESVFPSQEPIADTADVDWLSALETGPEIPAKSEEPLASLVDESESAPSAGAESPDADWLASLENLDQSTAEISPESQPLPDWLKELQAPTDEVEATPEPVSPTAFDFSAINEAIPEQEESPLDLIAQSMHAEDTSSDQADAFAEPEMEADQVPSEVDVPTDILTSDEPGEPELPDQSLTVEFESAPAPELVDATSDSRATPAEMIQEPEPEQASETALLEETSSQPPLKLKKVGEPTQTDLDATMAWLEALAARLGADEETLITPAEERIETPPDWISSFQEESAHPVEALPALEPIEDIPTPGENLPVVEESLPDKVEPPPAPEMASEPAPQPEMLEALTENLPTPSRLDVEPETEQPVAGSEVSSTAQPVSEQPPAEMDFDAAFAWLESLAAQQGAEAETLITPEQDRPDTPPDWIAESTPEETDSPTQPVRLFPTESIPPAQEVISETDETGGNQEPILPSLTPEVEQPLAPEQTPMDMPQEVEGTPELEDAPTTQTASLKPLPDWLKGIDAGPDHTSTDEPIDQVGLPDWLQETSEAPVESGEPLPSLTPSDTLPEWISGLPEPEKSEPEEEGEVSPEEVKPPDWIQELDTRQTIVQAPPEIPFEAHAPEVAQYDAQESIPAGTETPAQLLELAQSALAGGKVEMAIRHYSKLIQNSLLIDETIHDLRDALYRFPVDISIWQALGDAYLRNNQLQEALDAYTKAEEFLR